MSFPAPNFRTVHGALIAAFDGAEIDGAVLSSTTVRGATPDSMIPNITFEPGSFTSVPWKDWQKRITWEIPATLRVKSDLDARATATAALDDLYHRAILVAGLPVDEDGEIVPYTLETADKVRKGEVQPLVDWTGPEIRTGRIVEVVGAPYADISMTFVVEFILDLDRRVLPSASVVSIGRAVLDPMRRDVPDDWHPTSPPEDRDVFAAGRFDREDEGFAPRSGFLQVGSAIPVTRAVAGADDSSLVRSVNVTPYSVTVSVGTPTAQLAGVALFRDYSSHAVQAQLTWASSDTAVATVNSSGLVTRVGAGSCTVTASYQGVASNAVPVTST